MSDCYSGQSTRGVPSGRVSRWGSQDQELDGNTKMFLRPMFGVVLGFVECCERRSLCMGRPTSPLYRPGAVGVQRMIYSGCFTRKEVG